jgi:hypothetical protein
MPSHASDPRLSRETEEIHGDAGCCRVGVQLAALVDKVSATLARIVAGWLAVVAFLPFTVPFSTCTLTDVLGGRPYQRTASAGVRSQRWLLIEESDLASRLTRADVRPETTLRCDTRLMLSVHPGAGALVAAINAGGHWIVPPSSRVSTVTKPPSILRL